MAGDGEDFGVVAGKRRFEHWASYPIAQPCQRRLASRPWQGRIAGTGIRSLAGLLAGEVLTKWLLKLKQRTKTASVRLDAPLPLADRERVTVESKPAVAGFARCGSDPVADRPGRGRVSHRAGKPSLGAIIRFRRYPQSRAARARLTRTHLLISRRAHVRCCVNGSLSRIGSKRD